MIKKLSLILIIFLFAGILSAQPSKKLYKLYHNGQYVKCLKKCDNLIKRKPDYLETYYIKAIVYFDMAQMPQKYSAVVKDPLMECVKVLSVLRSKDPDGAVFDEHSDTTKMIYKFVEKQAQEGREANKDRSILLYQRLMRAYNIQANALELATIYAKIGDYERCMNQIFKFYERYKVGGGADDGEALIKSPILLAENWMFTDLFTLIDRYKTKFENNTSVTQSFKKALKITVDTARQDDDKTYFYDFSKKALQLFPGDVEISQHVQNRWIELVNTTAADYKATAGRARTWEDTAILRQTFRYMQQAKEIFPNNPVLEQKQNQLNNEFHIKVSPYQQAYFNTIALEVINSWRQRACECDTGEIVKLDSIPPIKWHDTLAVLAVRHAEDMFSRNYTDNITPEGQTPWDRINSTYLKGTNYENEAGLNYIQALSISEVLGYGFSLEGVETEEQMRERIKQVVERWMTTKLSQNCIKLKRPEATHVGLAMYGDKWVFLSARIHDVVIRSNKKKK